MYFIGVVLVTDHGNKYILKKNKFTFFPRKEHIFKGAIENTVYINCVF